MKKGFILITSILLVTGCSNSYSKRDVDGRYKKLDNKFYKLVDDVIEEKDRENLEEDFKDFIKGMREHRQNSTGDTTYLNTYILKSQIRLQNLKDLKD